jgi:hypothetical protein
MMQRFGVNKEMLFETAIRQFLGDKASHIAGQAHDRASRNRYIQKCLKKVITRIAEVETTDSHKSQIETWCRRSMDALGAGEEDDSVLALSLLRLCGTLIGFTSIRGSRLHTPAYFQMPRQRYTEEIFNGGDVMQNYYDAKDARVTRARITKQLKAEGYSDFDVALVLNISEYEVKKLRSEF